MGLLTPVAVRIGAISWLPNFLPQIVVVDKAIHRVSGGRLTLLDIAGLPNLTLTVRGRKTGQPRSTPLLCVPHGDAWLIAGSNFGGPKLPLWVGNLRAAGEATVLVGRREVAVTAREVEGEERARLWEQMKRTWPNYAHYEARTDRLIPVFLLQPKGPAA